MYVSASRRSLMTFECEVDFVRFVPWRVRRDVIPTRRLAVTLTCESPQTCTVSSRFTIPYYLSPRESDQSMFFLRSNSSKRPRKRRITPSRIEIRRDQKKKTKNTQHRHSTQKEPDGILVSPHKEKSKRFSTLPRAAYPSGNRK